MREDNGLIVSNEPIAQDTYKMVLRSSLNEEMKPGQFVNIKVAEHFLRRPISISSINEDGYTIVYKVVGEGTALMAAMQAGETLNVFGPSGSGFPIQKLEEVLLLGGGVGVPPLYEVAKQYRKQGTKVLAALGFNEAEACFYQKEFEALGCEVLMATMDGSVGVKGTVLDAVDAHQIQTDFVYSCGPMPMLKAIENRYTKGYTSFEARMACGIGACMGCVCKDKKESEIYYRICKEGPVFEIGKVGL